MASPHSAGIAVPGGGSSADSSSDAASAVAAVKSSAKSNKQRMNLYLPPEHQKMFDAVRSELGSLGVDDGGDGGADGLDGGEDEVAVL